MILRPWYLASALALAGCGRATQEYAVTEKGRPFSQLNQAKTGTAPPTARGVTAERLVRARAEPENWLTYHGTYDGQRFSPLDQINAGNAKDLKVAWIFQSGVTGLVAAPVTYAFEATPIVVDGVMFVSGYDGYVWALDAASGRLHWQYRHAVPLDVPLCCGNVNRGVAVADGRVFVTTQNGHLLALDAVTGKAVWDRPFVDVRAGESATLAPLVVKNLVIVGSSGAEYGVRGHIDAFDRATGNRVWRRYTIPKPGEPGSETWQDSERTAWERGGGAAWITGTYDPALNLLYWGTGNPGPDYDGSVRPGANLYTNSVLALDPDDGSIWWHYQWTPHDVWDTGRVTLLQLYIHGSAVRARLRGVCRWAEVPGHCPVAQVPLFRGRDARSEAPPALRLCDYRPFAKGAWKGHLKGLDIRGRPLSVTAISASAWVGMSDGSIMASLESRKGRAQSHRPIHVGVNGVTVRRHGMAASSVPGLQAAANKRRDRHPIGRPNPAMECP